MAVRQYIGARYVPLYVGDWDARQNYEPLTIVSDANGNSFTSLKDVPAGTPLTNRDYWYQSSSFSGAVDVLRRDVNALQTNFGDLQTDFGDLQTDFNTLEAAVESEKRSLFSGRYFLFVSDSFGDQSGEWVDIILQGEYLSGENLSVSGIGFTSLANGNEGNGVLQTLQAYSGDKTRVTDIVIACGLNDSKYNSVSGINNVITAGLETLDYIQQNFNCVTHIGFIGNALDDSSLIAGRTAEKRELVLYAYKSIAHSRKNTRYLDNVEFAMCGSTGNFATDRLHPSNYGSSAIATAILGSLGGGFSFFYPAIPSGADAWKVSVFNGTANIRCTIDKIININGTITSQPLEVDTIEATYFNIPLKVRMPIRCYTSSPTQYFNAVLAITFSGNKIYVNSEEFEGAAVKNIAVNNILFNSGLDFSFPTMYIN